MPITNEGRNNAFNLGLVNVIDQVEIRSDAATIDTASATFSYDSANAGRIVSDTQISFDVVSSDVITKIVLVNDALTGFKGDQWVINLSESYNFQYNGTFTLEDLWVQFTGPSDPAMNGGITEHGREWLARVGLTDELVRIDSITTDFADATTDISGNALNWAAQDTLTLTQGVQSKAVQLQAQALQPTIDQFGVRTDEALAGGGAIALYVNFATKTFQYPGPLTIEEITVTIV